MSRIRFWVMVGVFGVGSLFIPVAHSQSGVGKAKPAPKLEPVAETKLLMDGIADSNLRGLGKLLREKPKDAEAWGFARGQALLIAETGNLLLIRPPRTPAGQENWLTHAVELRDAGANLGRVLASQDYPKARAALATVTNTCNRCHQAFQVPTRLNPFGEE